LLLKLTIPVKNYEEHVVIAEPNENEHNIESESKSHTIDCKEYTFEYESCKYKIIDTPGFNATDDFNTDEAVFEKLTKSCLDNDYLNGVILFINGSCPRLQTSIKRLIEHLMNFLSNEISKNILLVLTNTTEASCNSNKLLSDLEMLNCNPKNFFMQNNIFKWNRESEPSNKKNWREISNNWEDSLETIKEIFEEMNKYAPISTKYLRKVKKQTEDILTKIKIEVNKIFSLIDLRNEIEIKGIAMQQANAVMAMNQKQKNDFVIEAIPIIWKRDSDSDSEDSNGEHTNASRKSKKDKSKVKSTLNFAKDLLKKGENLVKTKIKETAGEHSKMNLNDEAQSKSDSVNEVSASIDKLKIDEKIKPLSFDQETPVNQNCDQNVETPMDIDPDTLKSAVPHAKGDMDKNTTDHESKPKTNQKSSRRPVPPKPIMLNVKIDDNEAINQFKNAEFQERDALNSIVDLHDQIDDIENGVKKSFESITFHIQQVKSICKGFNFLQFFYQIQKDFKAKAAVTMDPNGLIGKYYEQFETIINDALKMD
jgi:hypothetical protein